MLIMSIFLYALNEQIRLDGEAIVEATLSPPITSVGA